MATKKKDRLTPVDDALTLDGGRINTFLRDGERLPANKLRRKLTVEQVMANFPFAKARDIQVEAVTKVVESYNNNQDYVLLEVPVGGGKSGIALAMARTLQDAFMVTLTEQLQNQYMKDFEQHGLKVLKGRGKYQCSNAGGSCALGKTLNLECAPCPYQTAKTIALASKLMVCNYHSFLANVGGPSGRRVLGEWRVTGSLPPPPDHDYPPPPPRLLAVWDEAHTMEAFLLDQMGLEVDLNKLSIVPTIPMPDPTPDPRPYFEWLEQVLKPAVLAELENITDPEEKEKLGNFLMALSATLARRDVDDWIPERPEDQWGKVDPFKLSMKPLQVSAYGHHLHGWADFNIFMSGTILSAWQMVKVLGLDPEKGDHVVMPSPFPAKNRLIYGGDLDMTYKARDVSWPLMFQQVDALMHRHKAEKGLILAPSKAMLEAIFKTLSPVNKQRWLLASGDNRLDNYRRHMESTTPTVLAAPGLWEGADLKGDASRFQILPAVPRAFFKGQTAARAQLDKLWYRWITYMKLLQGVGRSVRDETDFATTYILDKDFIAECKRSDSMIPRWVQEAVLEGVPVPGVERYGIPLLQETKPEVEKAPVGAEEKPKKVAKKKRSA
jgi:ATP-dependent DNA helicase DinG